MHCCGSAADIMGDLVEIGLDVLESVQPEAAGMNPYALKRAWGDKITFWGCLGSQSTIPFATPAQIRQEIVACAARWAEVGLHSGAGQATAARDPDRECDRRRRRVPGG